MATSPGSIGYVETVREDLLDAAWRSTVSPARPVRRRPSLRWVVAGATALTVVAAGVVGWFVVRPDRVYMRAENGALKLGILRPSTHAVPSPSGPPAGPTFERAATDLEGMAAGSLGIPASAVNPPGGLEKIVKTARLSIVVGSGMFDDRFSAVGDLAARLGGFVSQSSTHGRRLGYVTMRVPASRFQEALHALRNLGRVDSEDVRGQDVTAAYVDLSARIRIALARRRVLFRLMDRAVSIEQTIRVQNALDDVQLRIEELRGQLNVLSDRVSQATIRVSMRESGVKPATQANVENPSLPNAFDRAVAGFFSVIAAVIVGLGWVLPALALLALVWFVITRVRRRLA